MNGWPLQLLAVACLSLAAKMEERLVPSLLDLQVYTVLTQVYYPYISDVSWNKSFDQCIG